MFPSGIRIGIVVSARPVEGSLFQAVEIMPGVDFTRMEQVFIITAIPDSARIALERRFRE
jgi:cell shape-determining protein MreC